MEDQEEKIAAWFYDRAAWAKNYVTMFPSEAWAVELHDECLAEFRQISRDLVNGYGWDGSDAE